MESITTSDMNVEVEYLLPAPENRELYRKIRAKDPAIQELAASIKKDGLLDPIIITEDYYIISGHRRAVACKVAKMVKVPVRIVADLYYKDDDPLFLILLREFNRQRVKGVDEILREALIDVGGDDLRVYRAASLAEQLDGDDSSGQMPIVAGESRKRFRISDNLRGFANAIKQAVMDLEELWPVSVRAIHYELLNNPPLKNSKTQASLYSNDTNSYNDTSAMLTRLRLFGDVPWRAISDPTRPVVEWQQHGNAAEFISQQVHDFLNGFRRDCLQSQEAYVEVVGEKLALIPVIRPVCAEYGIPYMVGRGWSSIDARRKLMLRFRKSGKRHIILLVLGDHDPDGKEIAANYVKSLRDDFGIRENRISATMVAITEEQVELYDLPCKLKAKKKSTRHKKFVEEFGDNVWEVEALKPKVLQKILRESIEGALDLDRYNAEIDAAKADEEHILQMRAKAVKLLKSIR